MLITSFMYEQSHPILVDLPLAKREKNHTERFCADECGSMDTSQMATKTSWGCNKSICIYNICLNTNDDV